MKTKLVYVLTCAPEKDYIEQAYMAVWSARYHNPDATIVLIVDDKTDTLLTGKRGELINYISEKIVVPFEDATLSPLYRSRWIKTQVRELVNGEILFVDSDTICCRNISEVDNISCEIGAVGDNNVLFRNDRYRDDTIAQNLPVCDLSNEDIYYSSGVLYCKDTTNAHKLFKLWYQYWLDGVGKEIYRDQPSLAKANIELGYVIKPIDDVYNCVLYTQNMYLYDAAILHVSKFPGMSFLFKPMTLNIIREQGITPWIADLILHVHATYLPYDYHIAHSSIKQRILWIKNIAYAAKLYMKYVDASFEEWIMKVGVESFIKSLFRCHLYRIGAFVWLEYKRLRLAKKTNLRSNICAIY